MNRLEGLLDEPRPGAPRSITDKQVEDVVTKTWNRCQPTAPTGARGSWRKRRACRRPPSCGSGMPFGLQPHRVENFKFSKDPQFVEKVRDIVGLYLNPPDRAIVCV